MCSQRRRGRKETLIITREMSESERKKKRRKRCCVPEEKICYDHAYATLILLLVFCVMRKEGGIFVTGKTTGACLR